MFGLRRPDKAEELAIQATAWGSWGDEVPVTWAGANVSVKTSVQLLTVYGCVRFIADGIATLPVDVYRKLPDGTQEEVAPPSWLENPCLDLDRVAWLTQILTSLLLDGNAYLWLDATSGRLQIHPLDPTLVQHVPWSQGARRTYLVNGRPVDAAEIVHIPAIMFPGNDRGLSPVEAARQSIGQGMAAQEYGARFFGQGATMSGVIEAPADMPPGATEEMAKAWARKHSGKGKAHLPGVLTGGATWKPTSVTNDQAQFLETRQYTAAEIAGQMFLIDPSELGIGVNGTSLTYANLEQRATRRVQVTYLPWLVRLENAISGILARPRYMKFNVNGLLRGDLKTRYESYNIGIRAGFLGFDEAREFEDLPPRDDLPPPVASTGAPQT